MLWPTRFIGFGVVLLHHLYVVEMENVLARVEILMQDKTNFRYGAAKICTEV